ncbi:hypothetical protein Q4I28_006377 [Leishmania naiffi]|uniref:Uncharacterized protein n=1 Tax=Leishmania naiffi TaxID=5678 RepID=A0AAW3BG33_9TRYP
MRLRHSSQRSVRSVPRIGRNGGDAVTCVSAPVDPADAQQQRATAEFALLVDQLRLLHRCALVEPLIEGYSVGVTEWILSWELRHPANAQRTEEHQENTAQSKGAEVACVHRAFQHIRFLRCCGKVSQGPVGTFGVAVTAAGCAASSGTLLVVPAVPGSLPDDRLLA